MKTVQFPLQLERVQRISAEATGREQSSQIEKTKGSEHNIAGEKKKKKKKKGNKKSR